MPGADLTPARLEELLAAATHGPWTQHLVDETLVVSGSHEVASTNIDATYDADCGRMAADAALIALSPTLAARVIELEAQNARLMALLRKIIAASNSDNSAHLHGQIAKARTALETPNAK